MILGHKKQWQFLKKSAEINKISHAYLFSGQEHLGKKKTALEFASLLLGKDVENNHHPDLILIRAEEKEIQIGQIRDLIWKLSLKPYSAPLKVAIVDQAHLMNQESQNCFLKTLEEPKDKTLIILITEYPETLLPTILSRCEQIKFYPLKKEEIRDYLKSRDLPENKIKDIIDISLGRPGIALDLLENPEKLKEREEKVKEIIKTSSADLANRFQYVQELAQSGNIKEILDIWLSYFRNALLLSAGKKEKSLLLKLKNIIKAIQKTDFLIATTNVNPRLALEILMMEF